MPAPGRGWARFPPRSARPGLRAWRRGGGQPDHFGIAGLRGAAGRIDLPTLPKRRRPVGGRGPASWTTNGPMPYRSPLVSLSPSRVHIMLERPVSDDMHVPHRAVVGSSTQSGRLRTSVATRPSVMNRRRTRTTMVGLTSSVPAMRPLDDVERSPRSVDTAACGLTAALETDGRPWRQARICRGIFLPALPFCFADGVKA